MKVKNPVDDIGFTYLKYGVGRTDNKEGVS